MKLFLALLLLPLCSCEIDNKPRATWPVYTTWEKELIDPLHWDSSVWLEKRK